MAQRAALAALLVALAVLAGPAAAAEPAAPGVPVGVCDVVTDKTATPDSVLLGAEVEIRLHVAATCPDETQPGKADIVLAIDRSASQRDNDTWAPTIAAAKAFVDLIDWSRHQVAVMTFSGGVWPFTPWTELHQPLTGDGQAVRAALDAVPMPPVTTGGTNLTAAVRDAQAELAGARHRPDAQPVLVLLSDGGHNVPEALSGSPLEAAEDAKDAGTLLVAIGLAVDAGAADALRQMASRESLYYPAPTAAELEAIYRELAGAVGGTGRLGDLEIVDLLPPEVAYVEGSAVPMPSDVRPGMLVWRIPELPAEGWTARYKLRPLVRGTYATNKLAYVDYLDADGSVGTRDFPQPVITVLERGENGLFLPLAYRGYCKPARPFDVALVLDTSSSMWGPPLDRTREAASEFLDYLEMPPSRAAIVAFNASPTVVQDLTDDRTAAKSALDRLPRDEGSRIDLALREAVRVLPGSAGGADRESIVVLITDGIQVGGPADAALNAGAEARRAGITVYTIGFGDDVDPDLLVRIAGDPDRFFDAPTADDLIRVYRTIAGSIRCGPPR